MDTHEGVQNSKTWDAETLIIFKSGERDFLTNLQEEFIQPTCFTVTVMITRLIQKSQLWQFIQTSALLAQDLNFSKSTFEASFIYYELKIPRL